VNAIVIVSYGIVYKVAFGVTIVKHIIMVFIWLAYLILRYINVPEQTPLRIVFTVWYGFMLVIMLCFLAVIFYQMAQLMKNSHQESVKLAQKKVSSFFKNSHSPDSC
jgi:nitrogen fixation/metabolism regulation signal transduction histidine kinase